MSAFTAAAIVEDALRHLTVLDAVEAPTAIQITQGVRILNQLIQHEFGDVMSSFQTERVNFTTAANAADFTIGTGKDVDVDARSVHNIYYGTFGSTRYELREKSETHIFAVGVSGPTPVKFLSEMQVDGTLKVTLWPTPIGAIPLALTLGKRVEPITDETAELMIPPDAAYSLSFILASRLRPNYGIPLIDVQDVLALATQKSAEWKAFSTKNKSVRLRRRR